ncbi:hypothetical protein BJX68DRAFT_42134 [Aspergillus pseudodeflectus]|uniref:Uncharacterized protein n=1 Tax=Aspergillus pseudodeflectus TaxID=176178 RepID=A0ABR4J8V9_9EURO
MHTNPSPVFCNSIPAVKELHALPSTPESTTIPFKNSLRSQPIVVEDCHIVILIGTAHQLPTHYPHEAQLRTTRRKGRNKGPARPSLRLILRLSGTPSRDSVEVPWHEIAQPTCKKAGMIYPQINQFASKETVSKLIHPKTSLRRSVVAFRHLRKIVRCRLRQLALSMQASFRQRTCDEAESSLTASDCSPCSLVE